MNPVEVLLFAILQGVSELFPVSSLGHGVIVPDLFGWQLDRRGEAFLPFMVVLHLGTAAALLLYFRKDWQELLGGFLRARGKPINPPARLSTARAARISVSSCTEVFSGSSTRSSCERLVPIRRAISALPSFVVSMLSARLSASARFSALACTSS